MQNSRNNPPTTDEVKNCHLRNIEPSPWVKRFAALVPAGGTVLDLAAGNGRHARMFLERGCTVVAVDRDTSPLATLVAEADATVIEADLESDQLPFAGGGALAGRIFDAVVVVNYLYRPMMGLLIDAIAPGGVLIYETFARGNEAFAKPRNPDHLLKSGELLSLFAGRLQVVAYEHGRFDSGNIPSVKQRLCAINDLGAIKRDDGEPPSHLVMPSPK